MMAASGLLTEFHRTRVDSPISMNLGCVFLCPFSQLPDTSSCLYGSLLSSRNEPTSRWVISGIAVTTSLSTKVGESTQQKETRPVLGRIQRHTKKPKAMTFRTHSRENTMVKAIFRYFRASS